MISVVIPTYQGKRTLPELCNRLREVLDRTSDHWEVILVDDASPDDSASVISAICESDPRFSLIQNPRNLGQHAATLDGLARSRGAIAITIDDDLQQWPEDMPLLVEKLREGFDVAIARFPDPKHAILRRWASRILAGVMRNRHSLPQGLVITSFKAYSRSAVDAVTAPERTETYLATRILASVPLDRIANVATRHFPRPIGRSNYSLVRLVKMAVAASHRPVASHSRDARE